MTALPFLYPVDVGVVTSGGRHALLHKYTLEGNLAKLKKLLQTGVDVDCENHLGQTPLFCAALLGQVKVTELLLHYGANPNNRCEDWSTPVHAGVFSCNPSVVSGLLDAGGDLRLHDIEGRTPFDWLRAVKQSESAHMVSLLENCMSSMQQLCQNPTNKKLYSGHMSTSKLLQPVSLLDRIKTSAIDMQFTKRKGIKSPYTTALCLGFGKVCANEPCQAFAWPASIPLVKESELTQADDEPLLSFTCGSLTSITNCSWRDSRVTVKKLTDSHATYLDLLIKEQEYCSQLFHPRLLQLMGVSLSDDLQKTSLVFARVTVGTLHNLLHKKRNEFPVLQEKWLLSVMLQICEGLQYLHGHGLVMRSLSSHSVVLTELTAAKLTDLGFMVLSKDSSCVKPPKHIALPPGLYRWAAPEVIKQKPCTKEADIYSLCALIQEMYTDNEPWGALSLDMIKKGMDAGQVLAVNSSIPQPYYDVVLTGLQQHPQDRTYSLHCLCQILQQDIEGLFLEDQLGGGQPRVYPEQDLGPGVQTTTQHKIVGKPVKRVVFSTVKPVKLKAVVDRHQDRQVHKQYYSGAMSELWMEREEFTEEESVHHPADTHTDTDFESDSSEEEPEAEVNTDTEIVEQLEVLKLPKPTVDQQINTFVVDLKVSQELLRQATQSLDTVEDHLDSERFRDTPSSVHTVSCSASTMSSLSTNHPGEGSAAAGPHSKQYSLLTQRGNDWSKNLKAQLQDRNWELLSEEELALWLRHFPAEQQHFEQDWPLQHSSDQDMTEFCSVKTHHSETELSHKQQSTSSQENADVTEEVCRPAASGNPLEDSHRTNYESFSNTCMDPGVSGTQAHYTPNTYMASSDMALLAELSSITCSPAVPQEKLYSIYSNRQGPPCNSTPCNPDLHRCVMTGVIKAKFPDFPAYSHCSTEHLWMESSSIPKASSSKGSYTPQPEPLEEIIPSSLQGFITAIQGQDTVATESLSPSFHRLYSSSVEGEHKEEENREGAGVSQQEQSEEEQGKETERSTDSQNVMDGEQEEEMEDKAVSESKEITGGHDELRTREEETDERGKHDEKWGEEEKPDKCDPQRDPDKEKTPRVFSGSWHSPSLLEDTNRAHPTLDDVLQQFEEEGGTT